MGRRWQVVALAWAALLLLLPVGLAWTGQGTAPRAENRAATDFPTPARPQDVEWFDGVTDWVEDRLALSGEATRLVAEFDLDVAGRLPSSEVLVGADGFLFVRESLGAPCLDEVGLDAERTQLVELRDAAAARGLRLVLLVVPDKLAVEVDRVPAAFRDRARCLHERAQASEAVARDVLGDDALPMLDRLTTQPPSYFPDDTHWNAAGRRRAVQALVESLEPGMWDPAAVGEHVGTRDKDLLALAGTPRTDDVPALTVRFGRRHREEPIPDLGRSVRSTSRPARGQRLVTSPTLVVHDSFVASWRSEFARLFADATLVHWDDVVDHDTLGDAMAGRETLVVELVGRSYWGDSERLRHLVELLRGGSAAG